VHAGHRRVKVVYAIFAVLVLHMLENLPLRPGAPAAYLVACGRWPGRAVTFTTVGFGEMWPLGAIGFLCAVEALAGFVLITWSAAFTYLEPFYRNGAKSRAAPSRSLTASGRASRSASVTGRAVLMRAWTRPSMRAPNSTL
jgi:hypothetical protein